ncbi:retrovirus-related Pol polyprotein from transposon TNT 1-94 [Trichonephila clavipes]|nr:retrovirus-related Pol polyprotein from transposon TNT 1-94 [Trichonephila clavipes]
MQIQKDLRDSNSEEDAEPERDEEILTSAETKTDSTNWKKAMESEINSLSENHTWELIGLPVGAKAIVFKWVYRLKTNPEECIHKYNTRHNARSFSQRQDIDCSEARSPVAPN